MSRPFELQGHRGARGLYPENTLEGFRAALAIGVTSLELDVVTTADGALAVIHDPILNPDLVRGPDGRWLEAPGPAVRALTLAELKTYDVGQARPDGGVARAHPAQRSLGKASIPTLEEVFEIVAGAAVILDVEIKTDPRRPELSAPPEETADAIIALARRQGALDRLAVRSFDWRGLLHLRDRKPHVPLSFLTAAETADAAWRGAYAGVGLSVPATVALAAGDSRRPRWAPHFAELDPNLIAEAHALNLRVAPWTVNDPTDMARLIASGVDGLCTDRPDLARLAMAQAGLAAPTARRGR